MYKIEDFKRPITVSWTDILLSFQVGEEREYELSDSHGIRTAISRNIKHMGDVRERKYDTNLRVNEHGETKLYVRRSK